MKTIDLKTSDHITIKADYYEAEQTTSAVLYLHMMPATKSSWGTLATFLQTKGMAGLALDLRGHGESTWGPLGYRDFTNEEHQASVLDIDAAVEFLQKENPAFTPAKIILIGASIGANLALFYVSNHDEFKTVVALSPGLDYKGIETPPLMDKFRQDQKIFLVGSHADQAGGSDNANQCEALYGIIKDGVVKKLKTYDLPGHGTDFLKTDGELTEDIYQFIQS